jgi:hypothetical protein
VVQACNPRTGEAETGRQKVQSQPGLHSETMSQNKKKREFSGIRDKQATRKVFNVSTHPSYLNTKARQQGRVTMVIGHQHRGQW